ncbi:hypothetical protein PDESU_06313 [Pontiella desulfatans]|uniref:Uncharacterized protein n=1 Tax=Pontiella desulfatans TaxID=2750659 RepID=A0A6C2UE59_PONDE|nr:hypothetical protein PDESU_06313 [Pontiella desulfatans]
MNKGTPNTAMACVQGAEVRGVVIRPSRGKLLSHYALSNRFSSGCFDF